MAHIVHLTEPDLTEVRETLDEAAKSNAQVSVWIDEIDRGVKLKIGYGTWGRALGALEVRP